MSSRERFHILETACYAWRELMRRRRRSLWNIAGYAVVTCFLAVTLSSSQVAGKASAKALWRTGAQFIGFVVDTSAGRGATIVVDPRHEGFYVHNNPCLLFSAALIEQIKRSPNIRNAAPFLSFRLKSETGVRPWLLGAFDPAEMSSVLSAACSASDLVKGRFLAPGDSGVVLLEQTFAEAEKLDTGATIPLGGRQFEVVGIISPGTRPAKADIYMPLADAIAVVNPRLLEPLGERVNVVLVDGASALANASAMAEVKRILGQNSSVIGFGCWNPAGKAILTTRGGMLLLGAAVIIAVGALALLSQYSAMVERRFEIGVLKAIGWPQRWIVRQLLLEAVLQAFIGGAAGCAAAILFFVFFPVSAWLGLPAPVRATTSAAALAIGMLVTLGAATLAGGVSAFCAARIRPADILRRL